MDRSRKKESKTSKVGKLFFQFEKMNRRNLSSHQVCESLFILCSRKDPESLKGGRVRYPFSFCGNFEQICKYKRLKGIKWVRIPIELKK